MRPSRSLNILMVGELVATLEIRVARSILALETCSFSRLSIFNKSILVAKSLRSSFVASFLRSSLVAKIPFRSLTSA